MTNDDIAKLLGGELLANGTISCPGPGHSKHDRSLNVRLDPKSKEGFVVFSHSPSTTWIQAQDYVRRTLGAYVVHLQMLPVVDSQEQIKKNEENKARGLMLFSSGSKIEGTHVEKYLMSRHIRQQTASWCSTMLRAHTEVPFLNYGARWHAMLALYQDNETGEFRGIHRTMLYSNGESPLVDGQRVKQMLGASRDASIRLSPPDLVSDALMICEGIETGMSLVELFWESHGPFHVWAVMSARGIANFPIALPHIRTLMCACDNDLNGASLTAAKQLQFRWRQRWAAQLDSGQKFVGLMPQDKGTDWNNVLTQQKEK